VLPSGSEVPPRVRSRELSAFQFPIDNRKLGVSTVCVFLRELISQSWQALMRHRLRTLLTMSGIVWGLVSVVSLLAYEQAAAAQGRAQTPLQAHLESQQGEWVLGVPVEFTASVVNVSSVPVQTYSDLSPLWQGINFLISENGSTFHVFNGPEWDLGETMDVVPGTITLKPGARVEASFSLLWNGPANTKGLAPTDGFAFPHVGTYLVKVRASSKVGDLMSNVVQVVVRQPQGDDAAVWETLKSEKELARYYAFPNGAPGQGEKLQELLIKYPNSSHATAMKKALAEYAKQEAEIEQEKKATSTPQR
jgi:hypothetical protein